MIFFKGCNHNQKIIEIIPGFCSNDPNEPIQFMNPGLYIFNFDYDSLIEVDDWINGRDDHLEYRTTKPGVKGREGSGEIIINIPVKMQIVTLDDIEIMLEYIENSTKNWLFDTIRKNYDLYNISDQDLMSLDL